MSSDQEQARQKAAEQESKDKREKGELEERGETGDSQVEREEEQDLLSELLNRLKIEGSVVAPPKQKDQKSEAPKSVLGGDLSLDGVAKALRDGKFKKIVVMTGAGISVAAGIPDFRTPGTGLYDNLQKYDLPYPEAVFEISFFKENPKPFFALAKELYPTLFRPTDTHFFIKLLHDKGLLLRNFTQNIDTLERRAGVPDDALVEAHGSFGAAHCIRCRTEYTQEYVKEKVFADVIPYCTACKKGLIKPDVVFFGESLPEKFFRCMKTDFSECDLLIIIGTSLQVQPFASLVSQVSATTPRLLINREVPDSGFGGGILSMLTGRGSDKGFLFDSPSNVRDVACLGDCQEGIRKLAKACGWEDDLDQVSKAFDEKEKKAKEDNTKKEQAEK